jgi:hypothetical protein
MEDPKARKERLEGVLRNLEKSGVKGRAVSVQKSVLRDEIAKTSGNPDTWRKDI